MASQLQDRIARAKQADYKDSEIWNELRKNADFNNRVKKARAAGYSQDEIAQELGLKVKFVDSPKKPASNYKPFDNTKEARQKREQEALKKQGPTQPWESALLGLADKGAPVVQAFSTAGDAIASKINNTLGTNLRTDSYEAVTRGLKTANKNHETVRKANNQGPDYWRIGTDIATTLPLSMVGGSVGVLKTGVPLMSKAGAAFVAENAALGGLIGATGVHDNNAERLKSMRNGAIGGAVGGIVSKKVGDGITKAINIKQGRLTPAAQEIDNLGKQFNVRTSFGDVTANPHIRRVEAQLDKTPIIGTSGFRGGQQADTNQAATKIVDGLKNKLDDIDYKSISKIQAAANAGDKNAIRILGIVNSSGDDTGRILQAAAEIKNWRGQRVASQMYDQVGKLAGSGTVVPNKTVQAIDDVIAADSKVTPNKELLGEINSIRKNLLDPNINTNFKEMQAAKSRLGELVDEWGRQGKSTSGLTQIRTAIDNDIFDFAQSSGNTKLFSELKRANALYGQLQNGKDKAFTNVTRSIEPDQIFSQFMKAGKGDKAANFYKNLDPKGQAALRYQMAQNALDKAWDPTKEVFSPAKFAQEFERMSGPYSNIFKGGDKAQMDGFVKLMRHVEQAGRLAENPTNGSQLFLPSALLATGAGAVAAPISTSVGIASVFTTSKLFTTEAGKRILLAAKDLPPNSPGMANLLMQAQKLAVIGGANAAKD